MDGRKPTTQTGCICSRSIHYTDQHKTVLQIINTSEKSFVLPADQTLGQLDSVQIASPQVQATAHANVWSDKVDKLVEEVATHVSELDRKLLKDLLYEFSDIFHKIRKTLGDVGF